MNTSEILQLIFLVIAAFIAILAYEKNSVKHLVIAVEIIIVILIYNLLFVE